ncbi:MAG: ferritin-like domain-containing protein [Chloroflexi bacterium]|nr:ferritin-like domain-containing protein [Chloroflexota bacterium]
MIGSNINLVSLCDRLSEFIEVERLLVDHYGRLDRQALSDELRAGLRACRAEADEHRRMLAGILAELGGEPAVRSTAAHAVASRLQSLDEVHLRGIAATGEMLESLLLLESKSQIDWQLLQQIGQAVGLTNVLDRCALVRPAKDERIRWLSHQIRRVAAQQLTSPAIVSAGSFIPREIPPTTSA